ncbi:MAG TPA: Holliday junction branch migration protein RuvA [Candidatus Marinimicrobia bacterium]|jgi:Holliday junction DNA helicase RuvA|nr:Holliday junction branch migration protein RuvA [Candidatus Neomarinimicrobiota bacterium]MDP6275981.1 Holliday junction branch migration protein RuvA [Candidatus Neomarinimicrobiota bacterium]MDP7217029.1 Holliday junction branch migration protein RuvA [Candidatus Neomarinimicrobiota bacterium]MDP7436443.1 Holliday junction branch migration protein RuvA [Candidatus Neomarinimicrobiota bacterium]MDP7654205.1 Holliday junction branch migration protein RuvA [Candidatus Neomarinimicrobiota bact|tara:strand:+ start:11793 stop:12383 length:591 start_codon:yes stop_codon:yes gene_type:complete
MIDSIKGTLFHKDPSHVVLDMNGIRLKLSITVATYNGLPEKGNDAELLTYLNVREDLMELYGFGNAEERNMFTMLNTISGIGPRSAMNILSGSNPIEFKKNIIAGDVKSLTIIPGIGTKTAKRIIVELKEKYVDEDDDNLDFMTSADDGVAGDAVIALISLGYKRGQVNQAIRALEAEGELDGSIETIIKKALSKL